MGNTAIALLDANNFYVSCESAFEVAALGKPAVVLSNNDGCVVSRSEEAKQIGVTMGSPLFKVESLLDQNDAYIYSSNYTLYGDLSDRIMSLLYNFTPEVEINSIDEAFLSLEPRKNSLDKLGWSIKEKIHKWTGIPVSIGIAETKVLSKLANRLAKKSDRARGVLNLYRSPHLELALKRTDACDVWQIGRKSADKLKDYGILTAWQLREAEHRLVRRLLTVKGARIALELRGIKCLPLVPTVQDKKSTACTRNLPQSITCYQDLKDAVLSFLTVATERMRKSNLAAKAVTVSIGTDRFRPVPYEYLKAATYKSVYPSDVNCELQEWTLLMLDEIFKKGIEYKRVGVVLTGLVRTDKTTKRLFDDVKFERWHNLLRAIDEINRKFGKHTVRFGCVKTGGIWKMKQTRKSQRYTTDWNELLVV
jgi:DNA polymerase V